MRMILINMDVDMGDREMVKQIIVNSCEDCPHRIWEDGEDPAEGRICELTGNYIGDEYMITIRATPDIERIPDWCPLDEVKE